MNLNSEMSFLPPKYAITDERMRVRTVNESATSFQLQWKWQRFPSRNFSLEFIGKREEVIRKYWHVSSWATMTTITTFHLRKHSSHSTER